MNLADLYRQFPAAQHNRLHAISDRVFIRTPRNYFTGQPTEKVLQFGISSDGNLFRISNSDFPDAITTRLDELGIE